MCNVLENINFHINRSLIYDKFMLSLSFIDTFHKSRVKLEFTYEFRQHFRKDVKILAQV